jgi:hypothetical protein
VLDTAITRTADGKITVEIRCERKEEMRIILLHISTRGFSLTTSMPQGCNKRSKPVNSQQLQDKFIV